MIKQIGPHRIKCGNILDGITGLTGGRQIDIIYSDPPWGDGLIKVFAGMAAKATGREQRVVPNKELLAHFFQIAKIHKPKFLLVEYGIKWRQDVTEAGLQAGFVRHGIIPLFYKSGAKLSPLDLHLFSAAGVAYPEGYEERVKNTSGYNTLKAAIPPLIASIGAKTILDPFCGLGYTAQAAVDFDLQFFGNELNPARLAKTEARLVKGKKR